MDALDSALKIEERLVMKATLAHIPLGGTFELLPLCNMNCHMCFIRLSREEMDLRGSLRSVEEWLEIARQMKESGTLFVLLTGGEPFLYPGFLDLYQGLKKLGMIITINTNGTLITPQIAAALGKDKPRRVNITLYGASNQTYERLCHYPNGFDQTCKGIELLLEQKIDIKLNGTIVPENVHEIDALFEIAKHYGLYIKMDTYMYPSSRERLHPFHPESRLSPKEAAQAALKIKKHQMSQEEFTAYQNHMLNHPSLPNQDSSIQCRAGKSAFWINWYGDMTSCIFMKKPGINVFENGFEKSWKYLLENTSKIQLTGCLSCTKKSVCQVCAACMYCECGCFDQKPDYMCQYTDELIKQLEDMK